MLRFAFLAVFVSHHLLPRYVATLGLGFHKEKIRKDSNDTRSKGRRSRLPALRQEREGLIG